MIIRQYIQCETCEKIFIVRVSVGANKDHLHSLHCIECHEPIEINLHSDFSNLTAFIECKENCCIVKNPPEFQNLTVVNLHPNLPIPEDKIHDDQYCPNIDLAKQIFEKQMELSEDKNLGMPLDAWEKIYSQSNSDIENWKIIKKAWSLLISHKEQLANEIIKNYKFYNFPSSNKFNEVLFHFISIRLSPYKNELLNELHDQTKIAFSGSEYREFMSYYRNYLKEIYFQRFYEIFCNYFQVYEEISQVENIVKYGFSLKGNVTSCGFVKIKMFYGNCYEIITDLFLILSCLNNILSGRRFDEFKQMNLKKYLTINKEGRHKNFSDNLIFSKLTDHLRNDLRNASHHQNMLLSGKYIKYRKKGHGEWMKISYTDYLILCNQIFFDVCILFQYEMILLRV
ncbi:hypothetical protein [Legionella sp. 29fVS95]|uniref:hypothetical protein n=1 Tax=Legionella sp. 29fVS95 TaxID=3402813 RepID=UPI003AF68151